VEHLGVAGGKVRIVRHGIDPRRASPPPGVSAPLILYVGSILNRRHVSDLVRAFARIAGDWPEARLVIAGDNRTQPYEDPAALAADLGIAKHVDVRSYVPEDDLDGLYAGAALFVFLSEYEGFGFPPLEAMSAGVPVVVGDTPAARETCGDAATYVPIGDVAATSAAMRTLLQDDDLRAGQIARGTPVLRRYQWNVAAAETLGALLDAARGDE
jgi:glycosyltransferase involved in cell wall biosynthesis